MNKITIPGREQTDHRAKQARAERDESFSRREVPGATYEMVGSEQTHQAEPRDQIALREPPGYEHASDLLNLLAPGGPRIWPVSQQIARAKAESRSAVFDSASRDAFEDAVDFAVKSINDSSDLFHNRQGEGEERQRQRPRGDQADIPIERYRTI